MHLAEGRVLKKFDPWGSPLCTCPPKLVLNPYTGCGHACAYCYAACYVPKFYEPRPKKGLLEALERDLKRLPRGALVELSTSTDPYQPLEAKYFLASRALRRLAEAGARVLVTTKSSLVLRDLPLLKKMSPRVAVAVTVTTLSDAVARAIEPGAPPPSERIAAIKVLAREGIPVAARFDPVMPGVNDDLSEAEKLLKALAEAGASQVTCSTLKVRREVFARVAAACPRAAEKLKELYFERGERFGAYLYAERRWREELLKALKELAEGFGMGFQTCREGFPQLATPGFSCDGSALAQG